MSKGLCLDIIVIAQENPELPAIEFVTGMKAMAGKTIVVKL